LFDPRRSPDELVRDDDWFEPPNAPPEWKALFAVDTVEKRRRWFLNLVEIGEIAGERR
jgi:hypothetical protein